MTNFRIEAARPERRAILRKIKRPLIDTIKFRRGDEIPRGIYMFVAPIGTQLPDGSIKTESYTNMVQSSQLGVPCEFDLYGVRTDFMRLDTEHDSMNDYMYFNDLATLALFFGQRPYMSVPYSHIPGALKDMRPGEVDELADINRQRIIVQFAPPLNPDPLSDAPRGSKKLFEVDGKPCVIGSNEPFHWEVRFDEDIEGRYRDSDGIIRAKSDFKFRISMIGMYYAPL